MQLYLDWIKGFTLFAFKICLATIGVAFLSAAASVAALFIIRRENSMKKFLVLLGICILVLCLTACGALMPSAAPEFASENEMLTYLNGMWATGSGENAKYYIVQDGNVYDVSGSDLFDLMNDLLNDAFTHKGVDGLIALDYQTVLSKLGNEKMLGKKSKVQIDPSQGTITINQGKGTEKSIRVKNDDVCVEYKNVTSRENLTKISETVDFSGERFASLFDDLKKNYTIPAAKFWLTTKEYADSMKDSVVEYPFWKLVSMDEKSEVYSLSIPNRTGTFSVTEDIFIYSEKFTYSTYFGTEELSTLFIYRPTAPGSELSITDTASPNPAELILHAAVVTHRFPGAPDSQLLYDTLMKASGSVSSGMKTVEKTISGITYKLHISTDGTGAQIFVDAPEVFKLSDIMKYYKPADRPTQDNTPDNGGSSSGDNSSGGNSSGGNSSGDNSSDDNSSGSGSSSQQPAECTHNYAQATCTEPQKCIKCGKTTGSALGHKYSEATCTAPKTCTQCGITNGWELGHDYSRATCTTPQTCSRCGETRGSVAEHSWTAIWETVYHEEQGHYGEVQEGQKVSKYKCACGNKSDTLEAYYNHFDSTHGNNAHYLPMRDRYEIVSETVYVTVTKWIIDQPAYTETVIIGYECSMCDAKKPRTIS